MESPLSREAARVLGALVEKEMSTPEYYPLTLNALRNACNQKSNRNPVVSYGEIEVMEALDELQRLRLIGHVSGAGSRAVKYRQALSEAFGLSAAERAGLACLMLRGPQTRGEIRSRTLRLYAFADMAETTETLERLCSREEPLVAHLERMPGQKEARFAHLLSGPVSETARVRSVAVGESDSGSAGGVTGSADGVTGSAGGVTGSADDVSGSGGLRGVSGAELDELRDELRRLREDFEAFRRQFD